jgi:AAA domain
MRRLRSIEVGHEPTNPLLDAIGDYIVPQDWPARLERNPLNDFPAEPTPEDRNAYLNRAHERFATTRPAIRMAYDVQSMIRASYAERNPCASGNRKKTYEIAALEVPFDKELPVFYSHARCKLNMGITGVGKSVQLKRVLSAYPECTVHEPNTSAGWLRHTQVTYLTAKMSSDGSRNGLLLSILVALDKAAGTDYFNEIGMRRMTVEARTLRVAKILSLHSLGVLVIEEMQAENFIDSSYQKELRLFFLGILSFGIPMILVGNPRAFESLGEFKQTESRFFSVEPTELWPFHDYMDPDWLHAVAPAIWGYQVVDNAEPYGDQIAKALWECSGGIPAYARRLVYEVQNSVILGAAPALTEVTLREHFKTLASFKQFRPLIDALTQFSPERLVESEGQDIPINRFTQHWLQLGLLKVPRQDDLNKKPSTPETGDWREEKKKQMARKKSSSTRAKNKKRKNEQVRKEASKDDLRYHENHQTYLARSLESLQAEIDADQKKEKGENDG